MERLKVGDIVSVIKGDFKKKEGKIISFNKDRSRARVENVGKVYKHVKPSQKNPSGGIAQLDVSIHVSNLMLIDPKTKKPGRVGFKVEKSAKDKKAKKVRVFKKTGNVLS